jgi:para-nitrobenzyl esterase
MAVIESSSGKIEGVERGGVHAFMGIPYAAAPVGARRFRPPAPPARWDGVRPSAVGDVVRQARSPGPFGELFLPPNPQGEDCLNLNVWTPDPGATGLPVLVWIHGGAFTIGSGTDPIYDGASFARNGLVVVTVNYRLGVDGFLHVGPDTEGSGNFGMLDQIAALEWVRDNIAGFGGDPRRVTIAGESAGGMSVGTLMAMPRARGLFQRAIPQSGAGHNGISTESANAVARELMGHLGLRRDDIDGLVQLPYERVLDAQTKVTTELVASVDFAKWGDVVATGARMAFQPLIGLDDLPKRPIEAIESGSAADVDVLIGHTAEEFMLFLGIAPELMGINEAMLEPVFGVIFGMAGRDGAAALATYRANRPRATAIDLLSALETDRVFRIPAIRLAEAQAAQRANVWMYRFSVHSTAFGGRVGAGHATELPYVFNTIDEPMGRQLIGDHPAQATADAMHHAWAAFVTDGSPGHGDLPEWPRYDEDARSTMDFGDRRNAVVDDPDGDERRLWDGVL